MNIRYDIITDIDDVNIPIYIRMNYDNVKNTYIF